MNPALPPESRRGIRLESGYYLAAFAGALLLVLGGVLYRTDQVRCSNWPPLSTGLLYAPVYLLAIGLLSVAWIGLSALCLGRPWRGETPLLSPSGAQLPSPGRIVFFGILLNLCGMLVPPFLADDALAYAAVGRAIHHYGANMYTPLGQALPLGDPFRQMIAHQPAWLQVGSAYSPAFNWLVSAVSALAGDTLTLHLRLFQAGSLLAMLLTTAIVGQAAKEWALQDNREALLPGAPAPFLARQVAARAMALVLFCPLTLIEGVNNAHNDSLLAVSVALFALFVIRRQPFVAFLALLLGPLIKASGLLLLGLYAVHLALSRWQLRLPQTANVRTALRSRWLQLGVLGLAVGLTGLSVWLIPLLWRYSSTTAHLLGSPGDQYPYCTRSIECIPRALLHVVLGMPTAAWIVGLCFRAASGAFLLYMAIRSERGTRHLTWAVSFLFFYYLYLHGYSHSWYLLSLLPLLTFAERRLLPAMMALVVSNLSHYVLNFAYDCDQSVFVVGLTELIEGLLVLIPPTVVLIVTFRRGRAAQAARRTRAKP